MAVIKNGHAAAMLHEAVVLDLGDLRRQGEAIIAEAQREAECIAAAAHEEVRDIVHNAAERGHAQGLEQGLAEGRARGRDEGRQQALAEHREALRALGDQWKAALEKWQETRAGLLIAARDDVLEFALAVAEKIIHRAVACEPSIVVDQVAAALALVLQRSRLCIEVHPEDRPLIEDAMDSLAPLLGGADDLVLRERGDLARGGCIITTAGGAIDASIERQIERLVETLLPHDARRSCEFEPGAEAQP